MVVHGDPVEGGARVAAREIGADSVHISADYGPYGRERDEAVEEALGDIELVRSGSPYAVTPGRVRKARRHTVQGVHAVPQRLAATTAGASPRTPMRPLWTGSNRGRSAKTARDVEEKLPDAMTAVGGVPRRAAPGLRHRPATARTWTRRAGCRAFLRWGVLHPRTLLAELRRRTFRSRAGVARVLRGRAVAPAGDRARELRPQVRPHGARRRRRSASRPGARAAPASRSSTPGMRQLLPKASMHNRVRMIVASFLVKDLHLPWWWGARHFMKHLIDGDLASNQHNWQWVAGSGTDAAPFFRVFNPIDAGQEVRPGRRATSASTRRTSPAHRRRSSTTRSNARSRSTATRRSES